MKRYINLLAFVVICAVAGCYDEVAQRRAEILKNADAALNQIVEKGPQSNPETYLQVADCLIDSISDATARREVIEAWMEQLLSFDFSRLNLDRQYRVDCYIRMKYRSLLLDKLAVSRCKPEYFAYQIRLMERWRNQLNRFRLGQETGKTSDMANLDAVERRGLYRAGATSYEFELYHLEKEVIDLKEPHTTRDETAKIRAMVEKFLGRPIRPREELEKDFNDTHHVEFTDTNNL